MDLLSLGLGLAVGFAIGCILVYVTIVRPMVNTIIAMKKLNFVYHEPIEPKEESMYPFIRED